MSACADSALSLSVIRQHGNLILYIIEGSRITVSSDTSELLKESYFRELQGFPKLRALTQLEHAQYDDLGSFIYTLLEGSATVSRVPSNSAGLLNVDA